MSSKMIGKKDFSEKIFYNFSLEKMVSEDDYYRRLDKILDLSHLYKDCKNLYGKTGNPSLDPVVFFKIQIVGFLENILSDRQLSGRIKDSLSIRLFLRYDIDEETPCHSTISRTRQRIPAAIYKRTFNNILQACVEQELVEGSHVSIDSTLLKANASLESLERKKPEFKVGEYYEKTKMINAEKPYPTDSANRNETHISRRDPDSKMATKPGTPWDLFYKDSISTDTRKGIIIASEITSGNVGDSQVFPSLVKRSQENLKANNLELRSTGADKGYSIGAMLKEVEELGVEPYVPLIGRTTNTDRWTIERFIYDSKGDFFTCPNGKMLHYKHKSNRSKRYTASYKDCKVCPFIGECKPSKGKSRSLFQPVHQQQYDNLAKRLKTPLAKKSARWRKGVERTFGELKNDLGIRKINTLGLENAAKKCIMAAAVYNLKKLLKYGYKKVSSPQMAKRLQKAAYIRIKSLFESKEHGLIVE